MPPLPPRRIARINMTPGPEMKDTVWVTHPTGKKPNPIPAALMDNEGMHHPEAQALVKGEQLYRKVKTPEGNWTKEPLHPRQEFHIRQVNQAAGYSDQPGMAWERRRPSAGLSEQAKYSSVPESNQFYTLDESLDDLAELQQAGASNAVFQDEIYLRNGANLNDSLTSLGEKNILVTDQNNLLDRFRQEFGEKVPYDAETWYNSPVRTIMPQSDSYDFAPQNRFVDRRNTVPLPPQTISSPQEQASREAALMMEALRLRPKGTFSMNTRSVQVGDMPEPQPIPGAYIPVDEVIERDPNLGKYERDPFKRPSIVTTLQPYTPSADLNKRSEELNNLLIDVGGHRVPYVAGASVDIAGKEYPRNPDVLPDAIDAIAQQQQRAARSRGQANVSQYSPTAPNAEPMWRSADSALDELSAAENTLRSIQQYDPAHNVASQGFNVSVDVQPGQPTTQAYNAIKRHGLSVDVGGSGNNNVLSANGYLPVDEQVQLARSLRSTLNPTSGMMGLADSDPEMAGLREQWKQQRESAIVDKVQAAKVQDAIARVRAQNGLGVYKPAAPRQTIEVLGESDIAAMRTPEAATPPQRGFTLVGSPATTLATSRPPRSAGEAFFQQNYIPVAQERALVPVQSSRGLIPRPGQGLSTNAQYDFAPDVDWQMPKSADAGFIPGSQQPQPNWIIPSAIAGGVLGAGALGYGIYNSQREDERKRQSQRFA